MCPTILAGQTYDLPDSPENIVLHLIKDRWPLVQNGLIPSKEGITFSLYGWAGRKSYQISVEPSASPQIKPIAIGRDQWLQYNDPIMVHFWVIKNTDEIPPQIHHITQKIEQIVLQNVTNVGNGITAIRMRSPFSAIDTRTGLIGAGLPNQVEISLYHTQALVELLYYRVTYGTLSSVRTSKTHKYNILV
jgi:hypothetical protein